MRTEYIIIAVLAIVFASCSKNLPTNHIKVQGVESSVPKVPVSFDDAMRTLAEFLSDTPLPLSVTKRDGASREELRSVLFTRESYGE